MSAITKVFRRHWRKESAHGPLSVPEPTLSERFPDVPAETLQMMADCKPYTMTSFERLLAFNQAVTHVVKQGLTGAIVECGVWKGGSMMVAASTLKQLNCLDRELYLFDTFEGMPEATDKDVDLRGVPASVLMERENPEISKVWAIAGLEEVQRNLARTAYPAEHLHYVQGKVEDTIPDHAPESISILRLDTDWYSSTKHELIHLLPRLCTGGVLIIDDYGHWSGAKQAVDEYVAEHQLTLYLHRIDYTGRVGIKTW